MYEWTIVCMEHFIEKEPEFGPMVIGSRNCAIGGIWSTINTLERPDAVVGVRGVAMIGSV